MELNYGQRASLGAMADRLGTNGVILADDVGMGKTRIAVAAARCVRDCGGRVAILVPPGLGYQWAGELRQGGMEPPAILRSLWQYLQAWEEVPGKPWFAEGVVVISHAFSNWRLGEKSAAWRCMLLPELYARWREAEGRLPRGYFKDERLRDEWVKRAAKSIFAEASGIGLERLHSICANTPWPGALELSNYGKNEQLRRSLEQAVGLGLGVFDLVVIDEAHKSRGAESGLTGLLEKVVLESGKARRLALTATPVELEAAQWTPMLDRIKADGQKAAGVIEAYVEAVRKVQECPHDAGARGVYKSRAEAFQRALSPYVLRRDKREEPTVKEFVRSSGEEWHGYRRYKELGIDLRTLSGEWRKAVCAAEALSLVTRQAEDSVSKRLRLTMGNGHGVAALMDRLLRDERLDGNEDSGPGETPQGLGTGEAKRQERAKWWHRVMAAPFEDGESALYGHPAIGAAVKEIERVVQREEKVLVFGRFTRPLRALVDLLNAREMLRSVDAGRPWPHAKVGEREWGAVRAAHEQLERGGELDRVGLDALLAKQYERLERQRTFTREVLVRWLGEGVWQGGERDGRLYGALRKQVEKETIRMVARAMMEVLETEAEAGDESQFAAAFSELVAALSDQEELDEDDSQELWGTMEKRLGEEYSRTEGGFARLLNGDTAQATRRLLQQGFQRRHGHPRVLVAQSQVGREGLNLHKSCRTVVMMHPEWNPGAVEQQIGRVDRLGSFWEERLREAIGKGVGAKDLPRIEFRAVVFQGTYDEWNWQVLRERWSVLRAQLHGVVIDGATAARCQGLSEAVAEIDGAAPKFSLVRGRG